jgi:hypothetical protein
MLYDLSAGSADLPAGSGIVTHRARSTREFGEFLEHRPIFVPFLTHFGSLFEGRGSRTDMKGQVFVCEAKRRRSDHGRMARGGRELPKVS